MGRAETCQNRLKDIFKTLGFIRALEAPPPVIEAVAPVPDQVEDEYTKRVAAMLVDVFRTPGLAVTFRDENGLRIIPSEPADTKPKA